MLAGRRFGRPRKSVPQDHPPLAAARQGLRRHARRAFRRDAQPARRRAEGASDEGAQRRRPAPRLGPALRETYVILTAHYDHLGIGPDNGSGDRIFNGANDDGSGTASVIEIASALSTLKPRPRRSLVFVAFYGEEHGLVGSRYYVEHPVVPLEKTVADINLEQVGRTDDSDGPRVSAATVTGYDYSDVGALLHRAARRWASTS